MSAVRGGRKERNGKKSAFCVIYKAHAVPWGYSSKKGAGSQIDKALLSGGGPTSNWGKKGGGGD